MKKILVAIAALVVTGLFPVQVGAKDMALTTPEGLQIILHEDNSWEFKKGPSATPLKDDASVELYDGRIIMLRTDYSWGFIDKTTLANILKVTIDSVSAKGVGKNIDVAKATKAAYSICWESIAGKIRGGVNKRLPQTKLLDCIKRVEKDEDKQENFVKGVGWTVNLAMKLDRGSINAVIECALDTTEQSAATPVKTPAGAPAKQ
jgi:hypothetical protein